MRTTLGLCAILVFASGGCARLEIPQRGFATHALLGADIDDTVSYDKAALRRMTDDQICALDANNTQVAAERSFRVLGNCSSQHRLCVKRGYLPGSQAYAQCLAALPPAPHKGLVARILE